MRREHGCTAALRDLCLSTITGRAQVECTRLQIRRLRVPLQRRAAGAQEPHDVRVQAQLALQVHLLLELLQRLEVQLCARRDS